MKKIIVLLTLSLIFSSFCSCIGGGDSSSTTEESSAYIPEISEFYPDSTGGMYSVSATKTSRPFYDEKEPLGESYPIYIDKYPIDQEGAVYDITDQVKEDTDNRLLDFLSFWYGKDADEFEVKEPPYHTYVYRAECVVGDISFSSGTHAVSMSSDNEFENTKENAREGKILEDDVVKRLVEYLGLNDPQIIRTVSYSIEGEESQIEYRIIEKSSDNTQADINRAANYVNVWFLRGGEEDDGDFLNLHVAKNDIDKYGEEKIIPYDTAKEYVLDKYKADAEKMLCEIAYRTDIILGYYVPCYIFYLEEEEQITKGEAKDYSPVYIPMVDTSSLTPITRNNSSEQP